jgi:hypothetical protein
MGAQALVTFKVAVRFGKSGPAQSSADAGLEGYLNRVAGQINRSIVALVAEQDLCVTESSSGNVPQIRPDYYLTSSPPLAPALRLLAHAGGPFVVPTSLAL